MPKLPSAIDTGVWSRISGSELCRQGRGWRKYGRMRVGRLYIAAIVEGKGSKGVKAGGNGATPTSAKAQEFFEGGGGSSEWVGRGAV
jgi:hypothetical protein